MALADAHRRGSRATRKGELKDLAFPARRHTRVYLLSPVATISISPVVNVIIFRKALACFVDEFPADLLLHSAVLSCSML